MARTHYTVTFPAASPGDEVTWPNTVKVYPDNDTQVPLQSGQSLNESLVFSGWSDAASVTFTHKASGATAVVTSGAPSASTGTAVEPVRVPPPASGDAGKSLVVNNAEDGYELAASPGGSSSVAWTAVKTTNYAASVGDAVPADASGAAFNVTLPAPTANARVTVKNIGATGTVTVLPHAAETIDGAASYPIAVEWTSRDFQSDGTNWLVV